MKNNRFGIVGCGMAGRFHADALAKVDNATLTAVFDGSDQAACAFAEEYGASTRYTSLSEMLAQPDIDIVSICTPTWLHCSQALEAVKAGKHVLVEKPVGIHLAEIDELEREAKKAGVKVGVSLQLRTKETFKTMRQAISEGHLGKIHMFNVSLKYYRTQEYYGDGGWRGTYKYDGGGALMNQGVHAIDALLWMGGPVKSVYGRTITAKHKIEAEDTAAAVVNFANGAIGTIQAATSTYPGFPVQFEAHGDKGSAIFNDNRILQVDLIDGNDPFGHVSDEKGGSGAQNPTAIDRDGHATVITDLIQAITDDREPMIPCSEGRKSVELIQAIYQSSREGRQIDLL